MPRTLFFSVNCVDADDARHIVANVPGAINHVEYDEGDYTEFEINLSAVPDDAITTLIRSLYLDCGAWNVVVKEAAEVAQ